MTVKIHTELKITPLQGIFLRLQLSLIAGPMIINRCNVLMKPRQLSIAAACWYDCAHFYANDHIGGSVEVFVHLKFEVRKKVFFCNYWLSNDPAFLSPILMSDVNFKAFSFSQHVYLSLFFVN